MIRVLIADDSGTIALILRSILEREPDIEVIGHASNGEEAVRLTRQLKPDLVTMDIRMPVMDGLEATRRIMVEQPTPIVVVSSNVNDEEMKISFRALEEGALAVLEKPSSMGEQVPMDSSWELVDTVRAMADLRVLRRINRQPNRTGRPLPPLPTGAARKPLGLVAIGCSTGGPQALEVILPGLPADFTVPVVIVQHISAGYMNGLIEWLQQSAQLELKLAGDGEELRPGVVYFAPDERHLKVNRRGQLLVAQLVEGEPVNRFRPSSTPLLESVAVACPGSALGVLLTGMGVDGAEGLLRMRQAGCHTIVQDRDSSVVYGMPETALSLDAVDRIVRLEGMAAYLNEVTARQSGSTANLGDQSA
ncbi:MAG: chemotaxis-specific protein-glutamate methyltransferase CheB [Gammaproteobacteria bacterium]|nr:chemotaxis-specific protein-glutamate methyltransferase CheB [Gammaproteobacteria bacterium]